MEVGLWTDLFRGDPGRIDAGFCVEKAEQGSAIGIRVART